MSEEEDESQSPNSSPEKSPAVTPLRRAAYHDRGEDDSYILDQAWSGMPVFKTQNFMQQAKDEAEEAGRELTSQYAQAAKSAAGRAIRDRSFSQVIWNSIVINKLFSLMTSSMLWTVT
jgi:hypothetical protein